MTLKEFDAIRSYLPKNINIIIELPNTASSNKGHLIKETWGNHDGRYNMKCPNCGCRYNMKCPNCGWQSYDIRPGEIEPKKCPICEDKENRK